jgi:annexin A7/11
LNIKKNFNLSTFIFVGTDEDSLINILCRRPSYQRVEITRMYKTAYGKDLESDIRSETSGNFQRVLTSLLVSIPELYCRELKEAVVGAGTDEDVLIEVMCTMSNAEIRNICSLYYRMFGTTLEQDLRADTSGNMKRLMTSLATGNRDESMRTDIGQAKADAESLRRAGVGRWGTDESEFNRILCTRNYEQLKLICQEYQNLTGSSLEKDIKKEFSGDIEDALLAILRVANNRPEFFARRLHKSMAGLGTNDNSLIRLCITRAEIDMTDIKSEFQRYYGKSLKSFISGDTSGHYKHALYALVGENRK